MALPKFIYVYENGGDEERYFVATTDIGEKESGLVGIYDLRECFHVRHVAELRRQGAKTWFKPKGK